MLFISLITEVSQSKELPCSEAAEAANSCGFYLKFVIWNYRGDGWHKSFLYFGAGLCEFSIVYIIYRFLILNIKETLHIAVFEYYTNELR